eukprot:COSAG02_NODE_1876_length_10570_cov_3.717887_4_plen_267_part_00
MKNVAQTLAVKVKSDVGKHTTPNPKAQVLQQGYHPSNQKSTVQISEPVMLSSWMHPWAMPPGAYQLFLTISPNYLELGSNRLEYATPSSMIVYSCAGALGRLTNQQWNAGNRVAAANRKAGQIYVDIDAIEFHAQFVRPVSPYTPPSLSWKHHPMQLASFQVLDSTVNTVVNVPASTRALICFTRQRINHICCDREALGHAGGAVDVTGDTITGTLRDIQHKGRFQYNSIAYRDVAEDTSSGARDPRVIAEATEEMSGTTVPDTTP